MARNVHAVAQRQQSLLDRPCARRWPKLRRHKAEDLVSDAPWRQHLKVEKHGVYRNGNFSPLKPWLFCPTSTMESRITPYIYYGRKGVNIEGKSYFFLRKRFENS